MSSTASEPLKGSLSESHFERLWQRMADAFGHKWTSSYGYRPNQAWKDGLSDMTTDDIKTGLASLKNWTDDEGWPPTLLQFRDLCKPNSAPAHVFYQRLPSPKSPFEVRKRIATETIAALRKSILVEESKPKFMLTPAERDLSDSLDWDRIRAASGG